MSKISFTGTIFLVLVSLFLFTGVASAVNSVRLECPITKPVVDGDSIPIKIFVTNDVPLSAFSIGFVWDKTEVTVTSAKKGAGFPVGLNFQKGFRPAERKFIVGMVSMDPELWMDPSTDVHVATVYMRVPIGTPPMCVDIDSSIVGPAGYFIFSPTAGGSITPDYVDCGKQDIIIVSCGGCVVKCKAVTVEAGANCMANADINDGNVGFDSLKQVPPGPYSVGVTNVKLYGFKSADVCSCTADVTVLDHTKPTITCPENIVKNNDPGVCGAVVTFDVTAADNCGVDSVRSTPASGSFFPVGVTTVVSWAFDASGNKDSCAFTVTVNDVEKPKVTCPTDVVMSNAPGTCGAKAAFEAGATDNCPGATLVFTPASGSDFEVGVTTVWGVATDAHGNKDSCSFTVTVNDTEKPVITFCPKDTTIYIADTETHAILDYTATATDNCPGVVVGGVPASGSSFPVGPTAVVVTATDAHGNTETCGFTVTVVQLALDFDLTAAPDTLFATEGTASTFEYTINLTTAKGFKGNVQLSNSALPAGVTGSFAANPVAVPGSTTFGGSTSTSTPTGVYAITFTGMQKVAEKVGQHQATVFLDVKPCPEPQVPVVSQSDFNITVDPGQNHADETLYITDSAQCGTLYWAASSDAGWVTPDPLSGSVHAGASPGSLLTLKFNTASLAPGSYTGHVTIVEAVKGVETPGATVTIILTVNPLPPNLDSVYVICVSGHPGEKVAVPIIFKNDEPLAGMSAGLIWNSVDVNLDSVSYAGSRVDYIATKFNTINNTNKTLVLGVLRIPPEPLIAPGYGLWATAWFTINSGTAFPQTVGIDTTFIPPGVELLFNDEFAHSIYPAFAPCSIEILTPEDTCFDGTVVDGNGDPIPGAIVELYAEYPTDAGPCATGITNQDGVFHICPPPGCNVKFVRAFKSGFYQDVEQGQGPFTLVLDPLNKVKPTNVWVDLFCNGRSMFYNHPVPVGSVIEAFDPRGTLCGQWTVADAGSFGFMPVYGDDEWEPGIYGCLPGEVITLKINGEPSVLVDGGTLHWTGNGDRIEACSKVPGEIHHCIQLRQGWNLVSWNIDTPNDDIETLIAGLKPNIDVILSFEGSEGGALTYDPALPQFSTLHSMDHFHGYWFRMKADDSLCLNGMQVAAGTPIILEQNWNLVSYLPTVPFDVPTALASIWDNVRVVLGYDNGAETYDVAHPGNSTLSAMRPWFGYWIKTTAACDLIYPGPVAVFAHSPADQTQTKESYVPRVALSNSWINLYGSNVKLNGSTLPAGSTLQAFNGDDLLIGECTVRQNGQFGFMPVYGTETTSDAVSKSAGSVITLKVNDQPAEQTISWTANGDRIQVTELTTSDKNGVSLPNTFTLNQNYPNPFNPETTIDYAVGKTGHVELSIYNVLGAKVKTLVSGYQVQGNYSVRWQGDSESGSKVASGVYFYKLTAGDYTEMKKMTLLK